MPENPYEMTSLVVVKRLTRRTRAPRIDRTAEKHHPASGTIRDVRIESVKHTADRAERKRGGVVIVHQVVESGINMTVGEHGLDNVDGEKSFARPGMPGERDVRQHFRRYRRRDPAGFIKEVRAYSARKLPDSIQTFEQCPSRPRDISGRFGAGDPQKRGGTDGRIRPFRLLPRILEKIAQHGVSLPPSLLRACEVLHEW